MKKLLIFLSSFVLILSSCSENKQIDYPDGDMSCNTHNIMETEKGFYLNSFSTLYLRYYDKNNGSEIMLCNKPECPHDGRETCTATYKDLFCGPSVMYNNEIYFAASELTDENIIVSLYKVSLDGSSLDHVKTLYTVKRLENDIYFGFYNEIVIHRGYAYINFDINTDSSYSGFLGGGFFKVNLKNGELKKIISYDDFWSEQLYGKYYACGDYIFFSYGAVGEKIYRLNIYDDTMEEILSDKSKKYSIFACDKDTLYVLEDTGEDHVGFDYKIVEFDAKTMQQKCEYTIPAGVAVAYDGKLIIMSFYNQNTDSFHEMCVYENGKKTVSCTEFPDDVQYGSGVSICSGKLYIESLTPYGSCWSCSFEELLSGKVQWKKEYDESDSYEKWSEYYFDKLSSTIMN